MTHPLAQYINHPSGFLALSDAKRIFQHPAAAGFISYAEHGRYWVALGGVFAAADAAAALLAAFRAAAAAAGRHCLFVQVPQAQVALFAAQGATVNQLGSTFALSLTGYSLKGTAKIALRNKIHRAQRAGLTVRELAADDPLAPQLATVSAVWLKDKGKKELAFMIGVLHDSQHTLRRVFAAVDAQQQVQAFITYVPAWGERPGYLHDLSRRRPEAPPGALELINAGAIEQFQREQVGFLHFGFTPFVLSGSEPAAASPLMARLCGWLYRYGRLIYPAQSQAAYKRKWGTHIVEPEFIAGFPLSLPAVWALLQITRSL